jgi:nucleoside-diphosphate-sugar epimerase/GT2 family glycosyltransferase
MSSCSVIMVAKQGGELLFASIETVLVQKSLAELIIVDNGNAPDIIARLQQRSLSEPRIKIMPLKGAGINFAKGCNAAARQATSEYLLLLKAGYLLPPDAIENFINTLATENKAMLAGGVVVGYDGSMKSIFRPAIVTPKSTLLDIIGIKKRPKKTIPVAENVAKKIPFEVATISSACMCIRAGDYKKLAGLDDEFFPQDEEIDFALRVQQIGGRVLCVTAVRVTRLPTAADGISIARQLQETKNTIRYLNKFFAAHEAFGMLFLLNMLIMFNLFLHTVYNGIREFLQDSRSYLNDPKAKKLLILALGPVSVQKNEKLAKKIVLVTGASSQTGLFVIRRLIASGAAVLAVTRSDEVPYSHDSLRWIKRDLANPAFDLDGYLVDAVVHCAPLWMLPGLVQALHQAEAKRIIAFSSTLIFSKLLAANSFEKDYVHKMQNAENLLAERCKETGIHYTIFRPTQVYGVGLDCGVTSIAKFIRRFGYIFVYPPAFGRRQPVHVDDLANSVVQAMDNETTYDKSYNLSGGDVLTYREMLAKLFTLFGRKPQIISTSLLPFALDMAGKISRNKFTNGEIARRMNDDMVFFHDDAKRDFGFHPRSFLSGGIKDIDGF